MWMPEPPSDGEKYLYVDQNKTLLYPVGVVSLLLLVTGMLLFSTQRPSFYFYSAFIVLNAIYLSASYFIGVMSGIFDEGEHNRSQRSGEARLIHS